MLSGQTLWTRKRIPMHLQVLTHEHSTLCCVDTFSGSAEHAALDREHLEARCAPPFSDCGNRTCVQYIVQYSISTRTTAASMLICGASRQKSECRLPCPFMGVPVFGPTHAPAVILLP